MKKIIILSLMALLIYLVTQCMNAEEQSFRKAKITDLKGEVMVKIGLEGNWKQAEKDMLLTQNDEIKTGKDGFAVLKFDEKGTFEAEDHDVIEVSEDTELVMDTMKYDSQKDEKKTLLKLNLGKILASASKLQGDSSFEVETPTTIVGVRGTKYLVEYRPEE